jgi:predicted permease
LTPIIQDMVSIFFVLALGFVGGKWHRFDADQTEGFNRLVLNYALPAMLFVSIARSTRDELFSDWTTLVASFVILLGWFLVCLLVSRTVFRRDSREAGIGALAASAPTVGFLGMAVAAPLFGATAAITVSIVAVVLNVVVVPLSLFFVDSQGVSPARAFAKALRQPLVLAPVAATVLVLVGIPIPAVALPPLALIGHATSGVAVFAAGLAMAAHPFRFDREVAWNALVKLILMPATALGLGLLLGMESQTLAEFVLLMALPTAFIGVILAGRYQTYESPAAATLVVTAIAFAATAPLWLLLVDAVSG